MTDDARRFAFLLRQKPICTQPVLRSILGSQLHKELRAKYKLELGIDLMDDRCANSFNCISQDSGCIGRPFPIDPHIEEALKTFNVQISRGIFKGREVLLAIAGTDCSVCPFREGCESPCATQESYLKRSVKPDLSPKSYMTVNFEDNEYRAFQSLAQAVSSEDTEYDDSWRLESLPLDCLTSNQHRIVEGLIYEGKTQVEVAHELGISQQAVSQQYELSIGKLKEFSEARKVIREKGCTLRVSRYYVDNMSQVDIAKLEGVSITAVNNTISRWRKKWNI